MNTNCIEIIRGTAQPAFNDATKLGRVQVPPSWIGIEAAEGQVWFVLATTEVAVERSLDQPRLKVPLFQPFGTDTSLQRAFIRIPEENAGFNVHTFDCVKVIQEQCH